MRGEKLRAPTRFSPLREADWTVETPRRYLSGRTATIVVALLLLGVGALLWLLPGPVPMEPVVHIAPAVPPPQGTEKEYKTGSVTIYFPDSEQ